MTALPIALPHGYIPDVKKGDVVKAGQVIAQKSETEEQVIHIVKELNISPAKARKALRKNPGDIISVGDVIAVKSGGFLGMQKESLLSRVEGTVARYERDTGTLAIKASYDTLTQKLISPVDGTVSLCDNEKIVINTSKNAAVGIKGQGAVGEGEIFILKESLQDNSDNLLYHLDSRAIGKIIVGGGLTREILIKGIGMGAAGIIAMQIADDDIAYVAHKKMQTPVVQAGPDAIKKLIEWKGKRVYLDGGSKSIIFLQG